MIVTCVRAAGRASAHPARIAPSGRPARRWVDALVGALAIVSTLAISTETFAQVVVGTVVNDSGAPSRSTLVTAVSADGATVSRSITDSAGRYRLRLPSSGAFSLRALRVGFLPSAPVVVTVSDDQTIEAVLRATSARVQLASFRVQGSSTCRLSAGRSEQEQMLWEQAVASLEALRLAPRANLTATTLLIDRLLDGRGRRVQQQRVTPRTSLLSQPWRSMPLDSLQRRGFVWVDAGDSLTYIAPSVDVLLSDMFARNHCLVPRYAADRRSIGLAFEPVSERQTVPDIRGVLWLSIESGELERLEFAFTSVPGVPPLDEAQRAGGTMRFTRLADASVHIADWEIRIPTFASRRDTARAVQVASVHVSGGRTLVLRRGADTLFKHPTQSLTGRLRDADGRPIVSASVTILGAARSGTTSDKGEFSIPDLLPGTYRFRIESAPMRSARERHRAGCHVARRRQRRRHPSADEQHAGAGVLPSQRRPAQSARAGHGRRSRRAERHDERATACLRVLMRWRDAPRIAGDDRSALRTVEVETDTAGAFQLCGVPLGVPVAIRALAPGRRSPS